MKKIELPTLSSADVDAILAALPLLFCSGFAVSDAQHSLNLAAAESLGKKLLLRQSAYDLNEYRVLCLAVLLAHSHLTGKRRLDLDAETQTELSRHFFAYNKLAPTCSKALDTFEKHPGL